MIKMKELSEKTDKLRQLIPEVEEDILMSRMNFANLRQSTKSILHNSKLPKGEYVKALAEALCSPESFFSYYNKLDDTDKRILQFLASKQCVLKSVLARQFPEKLKHRYGCYYEQMGDFPLSFATDMSSNIFTVRENVWKCLTLHMEEIMPREKLIPEMDFKSAENFFSEDDGLEFFKNIPQIMQVLTDSNFFDRDVGGSILKGTLSKISKIADFKKFTTKDRVENLNPKFYKGDKQFVSNASLEKLENSRMILALSFLLAAMKKSLSVPKEKSKIQQLLSTPEKFYRTLIQNFFNSETLLFDKAYLHPHISLSGEYYVVSPGLERAKALGKYLEKISANLPLDAINFQDYLRILDEADFPQFLDKMNPCMKVQSISFYDDYEVIYKDEDRIFISKGAAYKNLIHHPAMNNLFLTLASIGLFEITWEIPHEKPMQPSDVNGWLYDMQMYRFGKIGAIKVTELGKYVFGLTEKISVKGMKSYAPPKLDEKSLIIHIEEGDKSMQIFLEPFCIQLSSTLYKADPQKLIKYCRSRDDVKMIFDTLGFRAKNDIPKIWKDLQDELLSSFVAIKPETDWTIISLEKQSDALINFINRLSAQGLCLKMEGKRIAVKSSSYPKLIKKIEAEGFKLVEE